MLPEKRKALFPTGIRGVENFHIVLWLIKDISWVLFWKPLGLAMIAPTIGAAIFIAWRARKTRSELFHNMAVIFWIIANAYWMCVEFFTNRDDLRFYAIIPFGIGLLLIAYYYITAVWKNTLTTESTEEDTESTEKCRYNLTTKRTERITQ